MWPWRSLIESRGCRQDCSCACLATEITSVPLLRSPFSPHVLTCQLLPCFTVLSDIQHPSHRILVPVFFLLAITMSTDTPLSNTNNVEMDLRPSERHHTTLATQDKAAKEKEQASAATLTTRTTTPTRLKRYSWLRRVGSGIILDIRSRGPWYFRDWTDAWNYRVVPATALIFFAKSVDFVVA